LIFQGFSDEFAEFQSDLRQHFAHATFGLLSRIVTVNDLEVLTLKGVQRKHLIGTGGSKTNAAITSR
jgi:hypothetical protein